MINAPHPPAELVGALFFALYGLFFLLISLAQARQDKQEK